MSNHLRIIRTLGSVAFISLLWACATPSVAVTPSSVSDTEKFEADKQECTEIAETYKLVGQKIGKAGLGVALAGGGTAAASIAVAGATIAWPATVLIASAAALGGTIGGKRAKNKERDDRDAILVQCMKERGYKAVVGAQEAERLLKDAESNK